MNISFEYVISLIGAHINIVCKYYKNIDVFHVNNMIAQFNIIKLLIIFLILFWFAQLASVWFLRLTIKCYFELQTYVRILFIVCATISKITRYIDWVIAWNDLTLTVNIHIYDTNSNFSIITTNTILVIYRYTFWHCDNYFFMWNCTDCKKSTTMYADIYIALNKSPCIILSYCFVSSHNVQ